MTQTDAISLLEARGMGRREPNSDNWLLRDINLKIERGCRLAIIGPTGSGKTLLMRALARLDSSDAGEVLWEGEPIHGDAIPRFRQQAIYLHQRPALVEGTVEENLRLPFTIRGHRDRQFCRETTLALLGQVDRTERFLRRSSRDLSGGEAQIIALLRAIQLQPTLLLLDEPTAALDDESTRMIEQLVNGWFDESPSERALTWVSHNREQVARVAGRVMAMSDGQLFDEAKPRQEQLP
ncbi:MAG TPA: ATP-binding cassette domain-containing protein [Pirellulaceae bacterium]|nr:ATP-binding cassette domain-containing protein [Pirellulaceae bacterium]